MERTNPGPTGPSALSHAPDAPPWCGILNLDKPLRQTSHDVVATVRRMTRQRQVGHTGTLDPFATGVLVVCLGQATKVSQYLMNSPKVYRASVHLGISTTTHDLEGEVVDEQPVCISLLQIEATLWSFIGEIDQLPPMHSAIKYDGKPLYRLARQGVVIERQPRRVHITAISVVRWNSPILELEIDCGPGTYIRALARDLGEAWGCGAHLAALRRLRSGCFSIQDALTLTDLEQALAQGDLAHRLTPMDAPFAHLPPLRLDAEQARRLALGGQVVGETIPDASRVRVFAPDGQFIGLADWDERTGRWRPHKIWNQPDTGASG